MLTLHVTLEAEIDIEEIGEYTQQKWGTSQRHIYLDDLNQRLVWLQTNWELGRNRDEVHKEYRSYHHARHVIFYRAKENNLEIIGILHERMDFKRHL